MKAVPNESLPTNHIVSELSSEILGGEKPLPE
jgi:hypothetical protein